MKLSIKRILAWVILISTLTIILHYVNYTDALVGFMVACVALFFVVLLCGLILVLLWAVEEVLE